jgi:hypothetical protein
VLGLGGVAFAVQFHHDRGAEGGVVLGTAHSLSQLPAGPRPDGELAVDLADARRRLYVILVEEEEAGDEQPPGTATPGEGQV